MSGRSVIVCEIPEHAGSKGPRGGCLLCRRGRAYAAGRRYYEANRDLVNEKSRRRAAEHPELVSGQRRKNHLFQQYGMTVEDFELLLTTQDHACASCRRCLDRSTRELTPHVDHDHTSGNVRGILCGPCNTGIGMLGDSIEGLRLALAYLERQVG